jgi:hypothetical protein
LAGDHTAGAGTAAAVRAVTDLRKSRRFIEASQLAQWLAHRWLAESSASRVPRGRPPLPQDKYLIQ